ncbi:MAG: VWA domain-containing protein [Anaerolineae bacterium]|nr:VWA domain-containing protein [Anaerolineae bacterium]
MSRIVRFILIVGFVLSSSGMSARGSAQAVPIVNHAGGHEDGITVTLQADGAPAPGGTTLLTFTATPLADAPDLTVRWVIPEGVELLGEPTQSLGAVASGQTVTVRREVRFPKAGTYKIAAEAAYHWGTSARFAAAGVLFVTVSPGTSRISEQDPNARSPMRSIMPARTTTAPSTSAPRATNDPCFDVVGIVTRIDKPVTTSGYSANVRVPVQDAIIEVREEDDVFDDSYGKQRLASDGSFAFHFCDDDGLFNDTLEIYMRLRAEIPGVAEVEDISWLEETYEFNTGTKDSDGGTVTFFIDLDESQSAVMNILDALREAKRLWTQGNLYARQVDAQWEPGKGKTTSKYTIWNEIIIADAAADPDAWDDTVIMHEFMHFLDDFYGCDENPGGSHNFTDTYNEELAWGEGYPDYFQSAVRAARGDPFAQWYIDVNGAGGAGGVDFETWDVMQPTRRDIYHEAAVAAALWDLRDTASDGQDRVSWGHGVIQNVFISEEFVDADNCNWDEYERAWVRTGKPADRDTAAAIVQNVGKTEIRTLLAQQATAPTGNAAPGVSVAANVAVPGSEEWWKELVFVVDNSASMAGPKFTGVKTVLDETVNDLSQIPEGTEFELQTFNNTASSNQTRLEGRFYPEDISPVVAGLSTVGGPDTVCRVDAFKALAQAVQGKYRGDAWLLTDGDTNTGAPSVEGMKRILQDHQIRASFALMGVCPVAAQGAAPAETRETQEATRLLRGMAQSYLGLAADPTPGGVVPYLLVAIASGGQFLFVDPAQAQFAGEILRAQMSHSAGAGRWSDYVSNVPTYRYETLASYEYQWIDATTGGTSQPSIPAEGFINVPLPQSFPLFATGPYNTVQVYQDGFVVFGPYGSKVLNNTALPNPALPNNAAYPFWDDLSVPIPPKTTLSPQAVWYGGIYTKQQGDWFAIQYQGFNKAIDGKFVTFQILLNLATGEIRYQYKDVPGGAGSATVGLEDAAGQNAIQISYNDTNGAVAGQGYKFLPAPPQPSKTYTIAVDSLMQGVAFLQTGYSGSFSPMVVRDPSGSVINCTDPGVYCLNLGRVQYVQSNVNGRTGVWTATVNAGGFGTSTFTVSAMAAGRLAVKGVGRYGLSSLAGARLLVNMGEAVDGNMMSAWFRRPNGMPFGAAFSLYDDGTHEDEKAGDGIFGSDPYTPGAGTGYLWVSGTLGGVNFIRSDPRPYSFQPLKVTAPANAVDMGSGSNLTFQVENGDSFNHCYDLVAQGPQGWSVVASATSICLAPHTSTNINVAVTLGQGGNEPSGTTGLVTLAAVENEKGSMSDNASARVTRRRLPAQILIHNPANFLRPNGDTTTLEVVVLDDQNVGVADGLNIQFTPSSGTVTPGTGVTRNGTLIVTYTSGATLGDVVVTARSTNNVVATTTMQVGTPEPNQIALSVSPDTLPADGQSTATLVATVRDRWDTPFAGQMVRIGVVGDGQVGTINGGEVISGTTDANGQFSATFTSGVFASDVEVRAELLVAEGGGYRTVHDDRKTIRLQAGSTIYMPLVQKTYR